MPSLAEALGYGDPEAAGAVQASQAMEPVVGQTKGADQPKGMLSPGNINLHARPVVKNADGSISTVRSMSFEQNGQEVLIPTVAADGSRILSDQEAIDQYRRTGQFLGRFDNPDNATAYAKQLHEDQAREYRGAPEEKGFLQRLIEHLNPIGSAQGAELPAAPESFRKEVISHESGGRPNIGWQNTDLTPYLQAGKVTKSGFPDWPGKPSGTFDASGRELPSTAAGLYGITKTNYDKYAPLVGVSDFSEASQTKVFNAMYADSGEAPWRPYWKGGGGGGTGGAGVAGGFGALATGQRKPFGLDDEDDLADETDRRERDRLRAQFAKFAADRAPREVELPSTPAAAAAPPSAAPATDEGDIQPPRVAMPAPPRLPAQPEMYVPKAPALREAYQAALASILQPKRNPLAEALRR